MYGSGIAAVASTRASGGGRPGIAGACAGSPAARGPASQSTIVEISRSASQRASANVLHEPESSAPYGGILRDATAADMPGAASSTSGNVISENGAAPP